MGNSLRLANALGRDGTVQTKSPTRESSPVLGLPGHEVFFRRYLAATENCRTESLSNRLGEDYAQALIEGDPEIDTQGG